MLGTKEHYDVMAQFEQQFKHKRLDREKDKALWKMGQVYEDGQVNDLFGIFLRGYQLGKQVEHLTAISAPETELTKAARDALSVCDSVSMSRDRRVVRDGCEMFLQTKEWCEWAENEVAPALRAALLSASPEVLRAA